MFLAVWQAFSLFQLFFVFPKEKQHFNKLYKFVLIPLVIIVSSLTLTKFVFSGVNEVSIDGQILKIENGPGIILFGLTSVGLVFGGILSIFKKFIRSFGVQKSQSKLILIGVFLMFILIIIFNFILPAFQDNSEFVKLGGVFTLPFIIFTTYAIIKHHLFNIRVIATQLIVFVLWIFILIRTLLSTELQEQIINGSLFVIMVVVGILLIKSVLKEVRQREQLQIITNELGMVNEKLKNLDRLKTEFLSLASHQLRSPLTAIKGYTSMLLEGSFGKVTEPKQEEAIDRVFQSSNHLIRIVEDLLSVSKIEQGGMQYEMAPFNFEKMARGVADELKINAERKGIGFSYGNDKKLEYIVKGDMEKIRQVVLNLIDNSIKYTPKGYIKVNVSKTKNDTKILFSVSDTGVGMSKEAQTMIFQKFGRGESGKLNTSGSGLGLYLAKKIVESHNGRIWGESKGQNEGSTFYLELDLMGKTDQWS